MRTLGDGSLLFDNSRGKVTKLPRSGDSSRYEIRFRDIANLRIDVSIIWEKDYVRDNYGIDVPRPRGRHELRLKGEWWDYEPSEKDSIKDRSGRRFPPMVVSCDENIDYHFVVRHWIIQETFICICTYHPDRRFDGVEPALSHFTLCLERKSQKAKPRLPPDARKANSARRPRQSSHATVDADSHYLVWSMFIGKIANSVMAGASEHEAIANVIHGLSAGADEITYLERESLRIFAEEKKEGMATAQIAFSLLLLVSKDWKGLSWKRWDEPSLKKLKEMYRDYWHKKRFAEKNRSG